jgi:hypothetical protein
MPDSSNRTGLPRGEASRPDWTPHIRERLSSSLRLSPTREREIVDELAQHLDDRWRELVSGGVSPKEAKALALQEFRDRDTLARPHGRPRTDSRIRTLVRQMATANPFWGAP